MRFHSATLHRTAALATVAALGIAAALGLNASPAKAYSPTDLVNLGYSVLFDDLGDGCHDWRVGLPKKERADLGSDCDPGFQDKLNAFVAATLCTLKPADPSCPQPTTAASTTTTTTAAPVAPAVTVTVERDETTTVVEQETLPVPARASFTQTAQGTLVTFSDASGSDGTITWQFGDGTVGGGYQVTHSYPRPGSYAVVETVVGRDGLASQTLKDIVVAVSGRRPKRGVG